VFDPTSRYCDHFNPLLAVRRSEHLHGDCEAIATLIGMTGEADDPVWEIAATQMITALMLVAFEHDQPTLAYVHDRMFDVCTGRYPSTSNPFVHRVFAAHRADHDKIRTSVNFQLRGSMRFMDDPMVRELTSDNAFSAGDLFCAPDPVTIFVTVPPADRQRLTTLMSIVMQVMLNTGLYTPTHVPDGRRKVRTTMLLFDEFPTLKKMAFLETNIAECRGYGIRVVLVAQDIDQIRRQYGEHQAITANCGTIVLTPGFSQSSLDTIGDWAGYELEQRRSQGRQMFKPFTTHTSESESRAPLLDAGQMMGRATDEVLIFRSGLSRPVYLNKVRYYAEPRWSGRYDPRPMIGS
jgi:type IV secretion system protein VirD4